MFSDQDLSLTKNQLFEMQTLGYPNMTGIQWNAEENSETLITLKNCSDITNINDYSLS